MRDGERHIRRDGSYPGKHCVVGSNGNVYEISNEQGNKEKSGERIKVGVKERWRKG
jgi:hypothetical protein